MSRYVGSSLYLTASKFRYFVVKKTEMQSFNSARNLPLAEYNLIIHLLLIVNELHHKITN